MNLQGAMPSLSYVSLSYEHTFLSLLLFDLIVTSDLLHPSKRNYIKKPESLLRPGALISQYIESVRGIR